MDDKTYARGVGERVRAARDAAGLTLAQLSERAAIAVPHLSRLEAGPHLPTLKTVKRVADALGVTVCDLLPDAPAKKPKRKG